MEKGTQTMLAGVLGIVLVLVGILGFFKNPVLGVFGVNTLHNVVHIVAGLIGIWVGFAATTAASRTYNKTFGVIYIVLAVLGFASLLGFLAVNGADNWLHLVLGLVYAGVGFFSK